MASSPAISVLDDDVLHRILCLYALEPWGSFRKRWESFLRTLTISHVCAHWRRLVVGHSPNLWRKFALIPSPRGIDERRREYWRKYPGSPPDPGRDWEQEDASDPGAAHQEFDFNREMVRRCHDCTFDAGWESWKLGALHPNVLASTLVKYAPRIETYFLKLAEFGDRQNTQKALELLKRCTVPAMRNLTISHHNHRNASSLGTVLPSPLFGGDLSTLQSLHLRQVWFDIPAHNIGINLTKIRFTLLFPPHELTIPAEIPTALESWIDILRRVPNLTSLGLILGRPVEEVEVWMPRSLTNVFASVRLPRLTTCELHIDHRNLHSFLRYIDLPVCHSFRLHLEFRNRFLELRQPIQDVLVPYSYHSLFDHPHMTIFYHCKHTRGFGCGILRSGKGVLEMTAQMQDTHSKRPVEEMLLPERHDFTFFVYTSVRDLLTGDNVKSFLEPWKHIVEKVTSVAVVCADYTAADSQDHYMMAEESLAQVKGLISFACQSFLRTLVCYEGAVASLVGDCTGKDCLVHSLVYPPLRVVTLSNSVTARTHPNDSLR